jgi:hypothetical protein
MQEILNSVYIKILVLSTKSIKTLEQILLVIDQSSNNFNQSLIKLKDSFHLPLKMKNNIDELRITYDTIYNDIIGKIHQNIQQWTIIKQNSFPKPVVVYNNEIITSSLISVPSLHNFPLNIDLTLVNNSSVNNSSVNNSFVNNSFVNNLSDKKHVIMNQIDKIKVSIDEKMKDGLNTVINLPNISHDIHQIKNIVNKNTINKTIDKSIDKTKHFVDDIKNALNIT